jgi:predicted nucleic acid-binding protein
MALILDSSLWVDFTRLKSPAALKAKIHPWIMDPRAVLCEMVAFEVLRHATAAERGPITAQFSTLPLLTTPPTLWRDAAKLGQDCRDKGTNAGSMDLLIAAIALHHRAELVTFDADYHAISVVSGLKVTVLDRRIP